MPIQLSCSVFEANHPIPEKYTGDGTDVSPPLTWSALPEGTVDLALICDDPDAPTAEPWVHWVIYKIPGNQSGLPEGVEPVRSPGEIPGAAQGLNSWPSGRTIGYRGPAPPPGHGAHHYHFKLYALDTSLKAKPGLSKTALLAAISGHVLEVAELVGTYER